MFVPTGHVESDQDACRAVFDECSSRYPGRVFLLEGQYDQGEIKAVIGRCEFFIGSRMHACIAAASQGIPTVPLAYSGKFTGVFGAIGADHLVVDLRHATAEDALQRTIGAFQSRETVAEQMLGRLHGARQALLALFDNGASVQTLRPGACGAASVLVG